ncbi:hypothetical protein E2C01_098118 [Portunus trituberculatus]|uniref:Uncharacterized protein n=1 Tax=Portunus trituberculatus TaxID=210409 RepID=A0A5B7KC25_PORTR|nr:hypothetical protein [Portunus trituberculatus]
MFLLILPFRASQSLLYVLPSTTTTITTTTTTTTTAISRYTCHPSVSSPPDLKPTKIAKLSCLQLTYQPTLKRSSHPAHS